MKKLCLLSLLCSVLLVLVLPVFAEKTNNYNEKTFYPVDQGIYVESFKSFRDNLNKIIYEKDFDAFEPIIAEDITFTFGDKKGKKAFIDDWQLNHSAETERNQEFWDTLKKLLKYGGTFIADKEFHCPYYSAVWPDTYDPYLFGAVLGEDVRTYKKDDNGKLNFYKAISYQLVKLNDHIIEKYNGRDYYRIFLPSGEEVYINKYYVGSPIGYRASFIQDSNNKWQMRLFINGD
ncbi:MAG: hypothetical protein AB7V50_10860 [Vampirovibrionia bacterium]